MLLHPESGQLEPVADQVLERLEGDARFTSELPAAQLEIRTAPAATTREAIAQLAAARRDLAAASEGLAKLAVAGVHPTSGKSGQLSNDARYATIREEYGHAASQQLVSSLQVHVAVGGAERSLAVYNALRSYLPELMALSANAPYYTGVDSGIATVRPGICVLLPRQGLPPALESWDQLADELIWGAAADVIPDASRWWWELRPHIAHGTLELRVPDAQTTLGEAAGVVVVARALMVTLARRYDEGEDLTTVPAWRIAENRWSAACHGLEGELADLVTGRRTPTRSRLRDLIHSLAPVARQLGDDEMLPWAHALAQSNGAHRQRLAAQAMGVQALPDWLASHFLDEADRFRTS